ncbi:MAG: hypothetical protein Q8P41_31830 [Pseudomonadota bacterium]|nr:hypothetical protein [Pseudomonadota bacterium]
MRKDKIDLRRYHEVYPGEVKTGVLTSVEFREKWEKRVVVTMNDWQVAHLVKQLAALPKERAEELARIREAFAAAAKEAGEPKP